MIVPPVIRCRAGRAVLARATPLTTSSAPQAPAVLPLSRNAEFGSQPSSAAMGKRNQQIRCVRTASRYERTIHMESSRPDPDPRSLILMTLATRSGRTCDGQVERAGVGGFQRLDGDAFVVDQGRFEPAGDPCGQPVVGRQPCGTSRLPLCACLVRNNHEVDGDVAGGDQCSIKPCAKSGTLRVPWSLLHAGSASIGRGQSEATKDCPKGRHLGEAWSESTKAWSESTVLSSVAACCHQGRLAWDSKWSIDRPRERKPCVARSGPRGSGR